MFAPTPIMRLMRDRAATRCTRFHPLFRLPPKPSARRSHSTTAADAAAKTKLTSPGAPLSHVFEPLTTSGAASSFSSVSPSAIVLHTSYASFPAANEVGHDVSRSSGAGAGDGFTTADHFITTPSYTVTDVAAFEQLIAEALRLSQVTLEVAATADSPPAPSPFSPVSAASAPQGGARQASSTLIADHTVRELQVLLAEAEHTLSPSLARKATIDKFVYGVYLPLLRYGVFVILVTQLVVYFHWIFFVFDWNLVEPTTYFLSYTGVFCSLVYHYHRCGEDGFTWRNTLQHLANRKAEKTYAKQQLDVPGMAQLQRRIALIKRELARMSV
ncbi:putative Mitochondrial calcium uniporter [Leishmania shawi]|uniref:Mitochondrial calcium uniporter n=1 Tax=Leishmania shawi TaxID=5680 RepID=A0AAW3C2Y5_9TRYP